MQILPELIGKPWDGYSEKILYAQAGDDFHQLRVVKKTDMMTCEFLEGRVTVVLEDDGTIWDVQQEKAGVLYRCP